MNRRDFLTKVGMGVGGVTYILANPTEGMSFAREKLNPWRFPIVLLEEDGRYALWDAGYHQYTSIWRWRAIAEMEHGEWWELYRHSVFTPTPPFSRESVVRDGREAYGQMVEALKEVERTRWISKYGKILRLHSPGDPWARSQTQRVWEGEYDKLKAGLPSKLKMAPSHG